MSAGPGTSSSVPSAPWARATVPVSLAAAVMAAGPEVVQPHRPRAVMAVVTPPLAVAAALAVGRQGWVAVLQDGSGSRWTVPLILEDGRARRATPGDGVAEALVELIASPRATVTPICEPFRLRRWAGRAASGERGISADQTHESVVVGEAAVVKWCTHLPAVGRAVEHPAPRRLETLASRGFPQTPAPWAVLEVDLEEGAPLVLAIVAELVPEAADGWEWAVDDVTAHARGDLDEGSALEPAAQLGRLTAGLHVALATSGVVSATAFETHSWAARAMATLDEALDLLDDDEAAALRHLEGPARRALAGLGDLTGTPLIDLHGDLHVGQVLRSGHPTAYAYVVTDFDGNPVLPEPERGAPGPAALDVASMMASLDHVGRVVVRRLDDDLARERVTLWIEQAEATFLAEYRAELGAAGRSELLDERALHPLRVQQEYRELIYAARHLPHWRYVPQAALPVLLARDPSP